MIRATVRTTVSTVVAALTLAGGVLSVVAAPARAVAQPTPDQCVAAELAADGRLTVPSGINALAFEVLGEGGNRYSGDASVRLTGRGALIEGWLDVVEGDTVVWDGDLLSDASGAPLVIPGGGGRPGWVKDPVTGLFVGRAGGDAGVAGVAAKSGSGTGAGGGASGTAGGAGGSEPGAVPGADGLSWNAGGGGIGGVGPLRYGVGGNGGRGVFFGGGGAASFSPDVPGSGGGGGSSYIDPRVHVISAAPADARWVAYESTEAGIRFMACAVRLPPSISVVAHATAGTLGDDLVYTYEVTNSGGWDLSDVRVNDSVAGAASCPLSVLAAGQSETCSLRSTVTPADMDAGGRTSSITALGSQANGSTVSDTTTLTVPLTRHVELSVVVTQRLPADATAGAPVDYTFVVENTGNVTVVSLRVFVLELGPISCPVTSLAPGESMTCSKDSKLKSQDVASGLVHLRGDAVGWSAAGQAYALFTLDFLLPASSTPASDAGEPPTGTTTLADTGATIGLDLGLYSALLIGTGLVIFRAGRRKVGRR